MTRASAHYRTHAATLRDAWRGIDMEAWLSPVTRQMSDVRPHARVLDIGAGSGRLAMWLAAQGHRMTAVEPVAELWEVALPRVADHLPRLPRLNRRYDLVLCLGVLHHLPPVDQRKALKRMATLTAPGGTLILATRHGPGPQPRWPIDLRRLTDPRLTNRTISRRPSIQPGNKAAHVAWHWITWRRT